MHSLSIEPYETKITEGFFRLAWENKFLDDNKEAAASFC